MDDSGNSTHNGTIMDIYTCYYPTHKNQQWHFEMVFGEWNHIINVKSGKCLTVKDAATTNNAFIIQWDCTNGANEEWDIRSSPHDGGGGDVIFVSKNGTNKCITVQNDGTANGSKLIQYDCNGGLNQDWYVD